MARFCCVVALLFGLAIQACDREPAADLAAERRRSALEHSPLPKAPPPRQPGAFDDSHELVAAAQPVLGTPVPRVARQTIRRERQASLTVEGVPFEAVERFYRLRLTTGRVEPGARGTSFIDARPRNASDPSMSVSVFLRRLGRATTISIFDETPSRLQSPPSPAAARREDNE